MQRNFISLLVLLILFIPGCSSDTDSDKRVIIIDEARILSGHDELMKSYRAYNEQLLEDYQLDFRVITTESDQDINGFANRAFGIFAEEKSTKTGRALLLVINTRQDLARLEVSMALEPIYTDGFVSFIEQQHMVRFLRDNRLAEGIFATTERIYARAGEAAAGKEFMADMPNRSLGGGAKVTADIGKKELNIQSNQNVLTSPEDSPGDVLEKYIQSRRSHNNNPDLDIFTSATKVFFHNWTVTPVQMDNEVRSFSQCYDPQTLFSDNQDVAVIFYPIKQRKCSPYLFRKEMGNWKLDFAGMNTIIRFNHEMKWHLILEWRENMGERKYAKLTEGGLLPSRVKQLLTPYLFAFVKYTYDTNGYAYETDGE